jgi:hypothetical protein
MTDLKALMERVESGAGADRELDLLVVSQITGKSPNIGCPAEWLDERELLPITSSLDAVLALIETKLPGWHWSVAALAGDHYRGNLVSHAHKVEVYKLASSPARALLAAALRAIQESRHD